MGRVVAAMATVHAPFITGLPQLAPDDQRAAVYDGFARLRARLAAARPDVVVVLSSEHITNILSTNVPPFCVGIGSSHACLAEFNLPEAKVPGDPDFARAFVHHAYEHGFDVAHSTELSLDHGVGLPLHLLRPENDVPVVPVLQNTIWSPMHTARRAFEFGVLLRGFIDQDRTGRRVALVAAGGISHWVGNARHGDLNVEFDEWFIGRMLSSDLEALRAMSQQQIDEGGDGANEIRSWISLAAAMSDCRVESIVRESFIPGWNVGGYQLAWSVGQAPGPPETSDDARVAGVLAVSVPDIERLIRDRHRSPDNVRLRPLGAESLNGYRLDAEEREALLAKDYGWLYRHGVHPMAVLFLSQDNREPMASYLAAIGAAGDRVHQLGSLFSRASSTQQGQG